MGPMSILGRGWQFSKGLGPNIASRSIATKSLTDPSIAESADALKHVGEIERLQAERARQEREGLLKLDRGRVGIAACTGVVCSRLVSAEHQHDLLGGRHGKVRNSQQPTVCYLPPR